MRFSRYVMFARLFVSRNGDGEIRTLDPLLARQVLSQLSYTPISGNIKFSDGLKWALPPELRLSEADVRLY